MGDNDVEQEAEIVGSTQVERQKFAITPEGKILLDLIRFPSLSGKPKEDDERTMRTVLSTCPGVLDKIVEIIENPDSLVGKGGRSLKILDKYYGVSSRQHRTLQDIGNEEGVTRERIRTLRDRGLQILRRMIKFETEKGESSLGLIIVRIRYPFLNY